VTVSTTTLPSLIPAVPTLVALLTTNSGTASLPFWRTNSIVTLSWLIGPPVTSTPPAPMPSMFSRAV